MTGYCLLAVLTKVKLSQATFKLEVTVTIPTIYAKWTTLAQNNNHSQILSSVSPLTEVVLNVFHVLADLILIVIL